MNVEADIDQRAEGLKETLSTLLDVAAMLAVAGGVGWGLWAVIGPWAVSVGGVLLFGMSALSSATRRPPEAAPQVVEEPEILPGPAHPGTLHVVGR